MSPARLKLTITVMSIGFARDAGGGLQQVFSLANTSRMLSTCADSAWTAELDMPTSSAAANQTMTCLRPGATATYLMSDATCTFTILSGLETGSPRLSLSTTSMPDTTSPMTVY
jgi:hypothetical protein